MSDTLGPTFNLSEAELFGLLGDAARDVAQLSHELLDRRSRLENAASEPAAPPAAPCELEAPEAPPGLIRDPSQLEVAAVRLEALVARRCDEARRGIRDWNGPAIAAEILAVLAGYSDPPALPAPATAGVGGAS